MTVKAKNLVGTAAVHASLSYPSRSTRTRREGADALQRKGRTVAALGLLCLVACGATATSASALPEFTPPFSKPLASNSGVTFLETVAKFKLKCASSVDAGEITGPTSGVVRITFKGCESGGAACASAGAGAGEILTLPLVASLGYINPEGKVVGLDLANPAGAVVAEFRCGGTLAVLKGSVIGKLSPVNHVVKPSGHFKLKFEQKGGKQKYTNFAGGPLDILETALGGGPFVPTGLKSTDQIRFAEAVEVKA
jgi:hypothetical protein